MPNVNVTFNVLQPLVININRDMNVEINNLANSNFVAYFRVIRAGVWVWEAKVQAGQLIVMSLLKNDEVIIDPAGTGVIGVTIL